MPTPSFDEITPMPLGEVKSPFSDPGWTAEIKFDGYRVLASVQSGKVRLKSRNGADATSLHPELQSLGELQGNPILDGEVCVLDDLGRSDLTASTQDQIVFPAGGARL